MARRRFFSWGAGKDAAERLALLKSRLTRAEARGDAHRERVVTVESRLDELRRRLRLDAQRRRDLEDELDACRSQLRNLEHALAAADVERAQLTTTVEKTQVKTASLKRRVLDERVLWDLLPSRAAAWRPDVGAAARESLLERMCPAYVDAKRTVHAASVDVEEVTIAGIRWQVPRDRRTPGRLSDRIVNQGWLPLRQLLQAREVVGGGVMIDIGANIGTTAIPRVFLGDATLVYAAEPEPNNYRSLVRNVIANGLAGVVLPDQVAIGATDGTGYLSRAESIGGHRVLASLSQQKSQVTVPVRMATLDSWTAALEIDDRAIRFIKADTQGAEFFILLGAPRVLALPHVAWQLEVSPHLIERMGTTMRDLLALVQRHFTHFIDLEPAAPGARVGDTRSLPEALAYLDDPRAKAAATNILVWRRCPVSAGPGVTE